MWRFGVLSVLFALALPQRSAAQLPLQTAAQSDLVLSFDRVLSIYEWHGAFDLVPKNLMPANITLDPEYDIHLRGNSRFLPLDSLATTDAVALITVAQPVSHFQDWQIAPFVTLAGTSYVTTPRPGKVVGSLITKQASGFGLGGLRLMAPDRSLLSGGVGLARQTQSAFGSGTDLSGFAPLVASGWILTSEDSLAQQLLTEDEIASASAHGDERFFGERNERYSNDSVRLMLLSGVDDPTSAQNAAYLQLGLLRRDYFFSPDSLNSLKQERTQYSLLFSDSLSYPITQDLVRAHLAFEVEPRKTTRAVDANASRYLSSTFSTFATLMAPSNVSALRMLAQGSVTVGEEGSVASRWSGDARMRYEERSETISLAQDELPGVETAILHKLQETLGEASYSARTTSLDATLRHRPSQRDQTELQGNIRLLSYDTPSDLNHDNHDDQITSLTLRHRHDFSSELNWGGSLRASRDHLVYLKSDRSAQNAVTNSLVLGSNATFAAPTVLISTTGEVFANYTLFDYASQLPATSGIGNYVLRGMTMSDTLFFPIALIARNKVQLSIEEGAALRISERGSYSDSAFSERRDTRVTEGGAALYVTASSNIFQEIPWSVHLGARGFMTSHSGRSAQTALSVFQELQRQLRIGPAISATLGRLYASGPALQASLWYAWSSSQAFGTGAYTKPVAQPESYLTAVWTF